MSTLISLKIGPISYVPFDNYPKDFIFIVNKEEYHTNRLIADLLSKKISKLHLTDPTLDQYEIFTEHPGDFQQILDLLKSEKLDINSSELPFFTEIIKTLDIDVNNNNHNPLQLTIDNVLDLIHVHEKYDKLYSDFLREDIEFISKNFYKLKDTHEDSLLSLSANTIHSILSNENLCLLSEDQLFNFVNKLYVKDRTLVNFYDFVNFTNVGLESISQFTSVFNIDDMTHEIWDRIVNRLLNKSDLNGNDDSRYNRNSGKNDNYDDDSRHNRNGGKNDDSDDDDDDSFNGTVFDGIFNQLRKDNKINSFVKVKFSSDGCGFDAKKLVQKNNSDFSFYTRDIPNSWISFNFNKCQVSVTHYTIRTDRWNQTGGNHPRSWVIEGFRDNKWEIIDERVNNRSLNGAGISHTFSIQRNTYNLYNSIRIRLTDTNWNNKNYLMLNSIEFYGNLVRF